MARPSRHGPMLRRKKNRRPRTSPVRGSAAARHTASFMAPEITKRSGPYIREPFVLIPAHTRHPGGRSTSATGVGRAVPRHPT